MPVHLNPLAHHGDEGRMAAAKRDSCDSPAANHHSVGSREDGKPLLLNPLSCQARKPCERWTPTNWQSTGSNPPTNPSFAFSYLKVAKWRPTWARPLGSWGLGPRATGSRLP